MKNASSVAIIGLGYVGLPLLLKFAEKGVYAVGIDLDTNKLEFLNQRKSYIKHISNDFILNSLRENNCKFTDQFSAISEVENIIICVPTPLDVHLNPDISYIKNSIKSILPYLKKGHLISLESTTYPGTTEEEIVNRIASEGFQPGRDINVVFSPEREDPGNKQFSTSTIPKVVGGYSDKCTARGVELYSQVINKVVPVSSLKVAEMSKLLENIYRAVNIGLVNEMKIIADKMNVNIWEVIDAAATKPFGFTPFYPGPGLGGHCIPIDPFYLTYKAKEYGVHTRFIELAGQVNRSMPSWVVLKTSEALNSIEKSLKGSRVLVVGVAYKKNIDDWRESPALEIIASLKEKGAFVDYFDPYVLNFKDIHMQLEMTSIKSLEDKYDCSLIITNHDSIDYDKVLENSSIVVDTRCQYKKIDSKIIKA